MLPDSPEFRRSLRESALLGAPYPLFDADGAFGPPLLPLCPYHELLLLGYENAFVTRGVMPTLDQVMQYLWICSPRFRAYSPLRFFLFARRWQSSVSVWRPTSAGRRRGPTQRVLDAIASHRLTAKLDQKLPRAVGDVGSAPPSEGPHELAIAEYVCRRALGYTAAEYWNRPYAYTNQLLHLHFLKHCDGDSPKFDPARDRAKGEYLRKKRQRMRPPS